MLTTHNLCLEAGRKKILQDSNLTISAGEYWGIIGANGVGKTTLLEALSGLAKPLSGEVCFEGAPLHSFTKKSLAQKIGILFQDLNFHFDETVWSYCSGGRHPHLSAFQRETLQDHSMVRNALHALALDDKLDQSILTLSGGEKRRLALATLLAQDPLLYLLDEPTNHLDIAHQIEILKLFKLKVQLKKVAVLMTLHDINHAHVFCTHLIIFKKDGTLLTGKTRDLLTAENLYATYAHKFVQGTYENQRYWLAETNSIFEET